jgi:SAM-dependent methyltransferase
MKHKDSKKISQETLSSLYGSYSEDFIGKRINSPFPIRAQVHSLMHISAVNACPSDLVSIADLGCGDGSLTQMFYRLGYKRIVGADISSQNISSARNLSVNKPKLDGFSIEFFVRDVVDSGFADREFDVCFTSHVLEHLSSFNDGLKEQKRLADKFVVVALPTAWSPISWTLLGGGNYWRHGRTGTIRLAYGFFRTLKAFISGHVGVDERGYAGLEQVPHIFFFPGRVARQMECESWKFLKMSPQVQGFPWLKKSIHAGRKSGRTGFGTTFLLEREK